MPLNLPVKSGDGDFKRCPSGSHVAVCNLVADVGLQPGSGMYPEPKRKLYIRFEIPAERVEFEKDGKKMEGPITIGSFYTASMHEKSNLRKQLEGWRGKAFSDDEAAKFDVASILGKACLLSVVETQNGDKTYANIKAISGLPKGMAAPKAENPLLYYADDERGAFDDLPPWLKEKIEKQIEAEPEPNYPTSRSQHDYADDASSVPF